MNTYLIHYLTHANPAITSKEIQAADIHIALTTSGITFTDIINIKMTSFTDVIKGL